MAVIVNEVYCFSSVKATAAEYLLYPLGLCKLLLLLSVSSDHEKHAALTLPLYPASSGFSRPETALRRATVCFSIEYARPRDAYVKWRMTSLSLDSQETLATLDPTTRRQRKILKNQTKQTSKQANNRFNKQNKNSARASHFFFSVWARLWRENVEFRVLWRT